MRMDDVRDGSAKLIAKINRNSQAELRGNPNHTMPTHTYVEATSYAARTREQSKHQLTEIGSASVSDGRAGKVRCS